MHSNRNCFHTLFICSLILGVLGWHHESTAGSLHLTWSDSSQNGNGFEVERSLGDTGVFSLIAILAPHETWYSDHNLAHNTTYCYRVRAYNRAGDSPYSNQFCETTLASDPMTNTISTTISNGAVLSGSSVVWRAVPSGVPARVEFLINGTLLATELIWPYQFNGDPSGTLNTHTLTNGSHQLKVRAIYEDNSTAEQTVVVTVSNTSTTTSPIRRGRRS